jgi:hypothetical protein
MSETSPSPTPTETEPPVEAPPDETPPDKVKKPRTQAQLEAFEKARKTRMQNIAKAKESKPRRRHRKVVELPQIEEEEPESQQDAEMLVSLDDLADRLTERIVKRMPVPKAPKPAPVRAPPAPEPPQRPVVQQKFPRYALKFV